MFGIEEYPLSFLMNFDLLMLIVVEYMHREVKLLGQVGYLLPCLIIPHSLNVNHNVMMQKMPYYLYKKVVVNLHDLEINEMCFVKLELKDSYLIEVLKLLQKH